MASKIAFPRSLFSRLKRSPSRSRIRRVRTPTVIQMEAVECGAAALAIVLGYHGLILPLEQLRVICGVSRDGTRASNVVKAARTFGLSAKGLKKEPAELGDLTPPFIVFWNFNHFLVVEGISKRWYYLNDPGTGPRKVSPEEFDQSFTGVVLAFEKTADFKPGGKRPSLLRTLASRLRGNRDALVYVVLASLGLVVPGLIAPVFTRAFIDNYLVRGMEDWVKPILAVMALAALLKAALTHVQLRSLLRFENKLSVSTTSNFLWHVLRLPMEFFGQRAAGEIVARIEINDRIAQLLSGDLAISIANLAMAGFYTFLMFRYDPLLTLIGISIAALNLAVLRYVSRSRTDASRRLLQDRGRLWGVAMAGLLMIETLKSTGSESDFFARWSGNHAKVINADGVKILSCMFKAVCPPGKLLFFKFAPVISRIAPQLTRTGEIIRWNTDHDSGLMIFKFKERRIRPDIRAIHAADKGQVSNNDDTFVIGIVFYSRPLPMKNKLYKAIKFDVICQYSCDAGQCGCLSCLQGFVPVAPGFVAHFFLDGHEYCVILEPALLLTKRLYLLFGFFIQYLVSIGKQDV